MILSQVIPETKRIKVVLVLIVRRPSRIWKNPFQMQKPWGNCTSYHLGSGWTSCSFEIMKLFLVKKQGYPLSCSKCLAISLETVLPEGTWMTQIGRTLPRMFDFRSVLALDHNEIWVSYQYLLCQPFCHSAIQDFICSQSQAVFVGLSWGYVDFIGFHKDFWLGFTKSSPKNELAKKGSGQLCKDGWRRTGLVEWTLSDIHCVDLYIYIYKNYTCI